MKSKINNIDENISEEILLDKGLTIENIVATLDLEREFDLLNLAYSLRNAEYEPETHPFLVYRPESIQGTILIPTNGQVSLVGCKSKNQLEKLGSHLLEEISNMISDDLPDTSGIQIQNIVIQGDVGSELHLPPIVVLLGMEQAEYEPEQFPGIIYRPDEGTTILIFASGKFLINGATSYSEALTSVENLMKKFREGGVPGDYNLSK